MGEKVIHHDERFPQDAPDEVWLPACAEAGWVVLTKDKAIRRRVIEREAHVTAGGRAFFLTSGTMTGAEMAEAFVRHLPSMRRIVAEHPAPLLALVSRTSVETHQPPQKPRRRKT
jgi:hypothetical protein